MEGKKDRQREQSVPDIFTIDHCSLKGRCPIKGVGDVTEEGEEDKVEEAEEDVTEEVEEDVVEEVEEDRAEEAE